MADKKKTTITPEKKKSKVPAKSTEQKVKLDSKTQLQVLLFSLLTFGVFYIILNMKIKESKKQTEKITESQQTLTTTDEIPFQIAEFIELLGGSANLINIDSTLNTLKVEVVDILKVDTDGIKKLGAKGILKTSNKLSIIFGDYASHLKNQMAADAVPVIVPAQNPISDKLIALPDFFSFVNDIHCEKPVVIPVKVSQTI